MLNPTPAVRNLIREGKTHQIYSVMQTGSSHGMQTMDFSLAELVRARTHHAQTSRLTAVTAPRSSSASSVPQAPRAPVPANGGARPQSEGDSVSTTFVYKARDRSGTHAKARSRARPRPPPRQPCASGALPSPNIDEVKKGGGPRSTSTASRRSSRRT